jgi:hypothetical protein
VTSKIIILIKYQVYSMKYSDFIVQGVYNETARLLRFCFKNMQRVSSPLYCGNLNSALIFRLPHCSPSEGTNGANVEVN